MSELPTGTVRALWRYPVKSMLGGTLQEASVVGDGLAGDREWGVVDLETGLTASAKHPARFGALLSCAAWTDDAGERPPTVRLPDGTEVTAGEASADTALSRLLGREVALRRAERAPDRISRTDPVGWGADGQGRGRALHLGDASTNPIGGAVPESERLVDFAPLHLVTTASLAALEERLGDDGADVRRFRPNVVLDIDVPPFAEDAWVGRELTVGGARLEVVVATPRCVVPTLAQPELARSPQTLRTVAAMNRPRIFDRGRQPGVGVYATVAVGGRLAVGDPVRVAGGPGPF